jgi:Xaa-Pro aminopeptidase
MSQTFDYDSRIDRAREGMRERDLDALLLTTGTNIDYFTGFSGMFGGNDSSRPLLYVLPREGDPAIVVQEFLRAEVEEGNIPDLRVYEELSRLPAEELEAIIEERGLDGGRIGAEFGEAMTVDVPLADFRAFDAAHPDVEFADASDLIWDLRMRKSQAEVELIREACEITMQAYDRTFEAVEAGDSESRVQSLMSQHMLDLGGSAPWTVVTSGTENYARLTKVSGDRTIESGEMVWLDCGCSVGGYWSDFSRAGVVGGPSDRQIETHRAIHDITRTAIAEMEPGRPISEVARICNDAIDDLDHPITAYTSHQAGRVGHGVGKQVTEPPSVSETDRTVLEPGMVLTVEPAVATDYGTFHVEENVVVTDDGADRLTPDRWTLWTI